MILEPASGSCCETELVPPGNSTGPGMRPSSEAAVRYYLPELSSSLSLGPMEINTSLNVVQVRDWIGR